MSLSLLTCIQLKKYAVIVSKSLVIWYMCDHSFEISLLPILLLDFFESYFSLQFQLGGVQWLFPLNDISYVSL